MTAPGIRLSQGAMATKSRPADTSAPHSGAGGWAPNPRKLSADTERMARASSSEAIAMMGRAAFGMT